MGKTCKFRQLLELATICLLICAGYVICEECQGKLNDNFVSETCNVGGCCIPSDGSGDTLCCIPTLTIILVSVFIGGTIVIIITVIICCAICRYRNKRKLRRRLEERRRRQRERDEERQRRLMTDPFFNGDPFQGMEELASQTVTAQPPRYHGQASDTRLHLGAPIRDNSLPPPYPNTPPPAYYSRMSTRHPTEISYRRTTTIEESRATTSGNESCNRSYTEVSSINISPPTLPPHLLASRINTDAVLIRDLSRQTNSRADTNVLTLEDLETVELDDELNSITDVNQVSRISTNIELNQYNSEGRNNLISQTSGKIESRMSTKPESQASIKTEPRVSSKSESRHSSKIESRMSTTDASRMSSKVESRMSIQPASRLSTTESQITTKPSSRVSSKAESRMSTKPESRVSTTESRISSKTESEMSIHLESRMSTKTMHPILENEITDVKRATFIKSSMIVEAREESKSRAFNKVRSIKSDEMVVKNLDFV